MEPSSLPAQPGCAACGHEHLVEFYETEEFLVASVADYVVGGAARRRGGDRRRHA